jgi:hypothetical protein
MPCFIEISLYRDSASSWGIFDWLKDNSPLAGTIVSWAGPSCDFGRGTFNSTGVATLREVIVAFWVPCSDCLPEIPEELIVLDSVLGFSKEAPLTVRSQNKLKKIRKNRREE